MGFAAEQLAMRASSGTTGSSASSSRHTTTSTSLSPARKQSTGLRNRRVLTQTLAQCAVLQKEFPTATKARVERALGQTAGDIDEARELLADCFFTGDKLIVNADGWAGELGVCVETKGDNVKITLKGEGYTVGRTQCRLYARADGTLVPEPEPAEAEAEDPEPEPEVVPGEDEPVAALPVAPVKKFALWLDPNAGDGTFRYRPEHEDEISVGGYVGVAAGTKRAGWRVG